MKFLVILRKERSMTNMVKMPLKREWVEAVLLTILSIYLNLSLVKELSGVSQEFLNAWFLHLGKFMF